MGLFEPAAKQLGKAFKLAMGTQMALALCSTGAFAANWQGFDIANGKITSIFGAATGWHSTESHDNISNLIQKAEQALNGRESFASVFKSLVAEEAVKFDAAKAVSDDFSTTVRFAQKYKGLEVVGHEAMVHFDNVGDVHDITGKALDIDLNVEPSVSLADARKLLNDRFNQNVGLSEPAKLKVLKDFDGQAHLVYHMLTRSTATHEGQEVFLDAHNGQIVLEFDRAMDVHAGQGQGQGGKRTVYSADTQKAHDNVDESGYPTDIDLSWYDKVLEDGKRSEQADRSALNAYRSSGLVYSYYRDNFNRASYDGRDSRIVSVVHMGLKMNNAFWTNEYKIMAYGDGDGERLTDLTYGLDVAAHELTHGVTASTANLVYAAESGALNESYSDFFGKMVDYGHDWDIGARIMAPKWGRRALRNMENPEEFKQPSTKGGKYWVSTTGPCTRANDRCGVHTNSGVPSRAAVLIVKAIGKEKAEQLYYKVLTTRLSATSNFHDARVETLKECALRFGKDSSDCDAVTKAYDAVNMQ